MGNSSNHAEVSIRKCDDADFRAIFDAAAIGICEVDANTGCFLRVNAAHCALTGRSEPELLDTDIQSVNHPDDRTQDGEAFARMARGELAKYEGDKRYTRPDGSVVWVHASASPIRDAHGHVTRIAAVSWDITAQKLTEDALRASEEKYRSLFECIDEGFCLLELLENDAGEAVNFQFVEVNDAFVRVTGRDNTIGKLGTEVTPNAETYWLKRYVEVAKTGVPCRFENYHRDTGRWYQVYASRVGGPNSRRVAIVFNDISERKIRELQKAFLLALSDTIRSIDNPNLIQVEATRLIGIHLGVHRAFFVEVNEATGRARVQQGYFGRESSSLAGEYRAGEFDWIVSPIRGGEMLVIPNVATSPLVANADKRQLGSVRIAARITVPLMKANKLIAALCVTESMPRAWTAAEVELVKETGDRIWAAVQRARAEAATRRSEEQLREADRQKDTFIAVLAHELRNPLAPIRTAAGVLRRLAHSDPMLEECRDIIDRQVTHMGRLLDDLLDVSRLATGKLTLQRDIVSLREIIELAAETARPHIDAHKHTLVVNDVPNFLFVEGDRVRLTEVFANLLNNAAKYTKSGGHIEMTVAVANETIVITVRDTGIGISTEMLPRVFDLFVQAAHVPDRWDSGLGIGLGLARRIVELHGGTVSAESDGPDQGSTFTVELPRAKVVTADADRVASTAGPDACGHRRVLVVDDNVDAADTLSLLLEYAGCQVRTTYSGKAALDEAEVFHPDLILLDIGMPGLDGYAVARALREHSWAHEATIVALTGWGQDEDRRRTAASGFDLHWVKPVDPSTVLALVGRE